MSDATARPWTPPEGMTKEAAQDWRAFYAKIRRLYGITPEQYRALYLAQLGRCFVCRTAKGIHPDDPKSRGGRRLGVDHNHLIGSGRPDAVRALLCTGGDRTCNRIIGWLDAAALGRARQVLTLGPAQEVLARPGLTDAELTGFLVPDWTVQP